MVRVDVFFITIALLAGSASATPVNDQQQVAARAALDTALDQMTAELLKPGDVRRGWEKGGADIYKALEAAPGGSGKNYLLSVDKDGERSITIVRPSASATYVPDNWSRVLRSGDQQSREANVTVANLDGPFFIVGWETSRRVEDAFCSSGGIGGELHRSSGADTDGQAPDYLIPALFNGAVKRFQGVRICWRFDPKGEGYAVTYFLEDGRALPTMNDSEEFVTIVPAQPVEGLLVRKVPQD